MPTTVHRCRRWACRGGTTKCWGAKRIWVSCSARDLAQHGATSHRAPGRRPKGEPVVIKGGRRRSGCLPCRSDHRSGDGEAVGGCRRRHRRAQHHQQYRRCRNSLISTHAHFEALLTRCLGTNAVHNFSNSGHDCVGPIELNKMSSVV